MSAAADGTAASTTSGAREGRSGGGGSADLEAAEEDERTDEVLLERISSGSVTGVSGRGHATISRSLTMDSFLQDIKASERFRRRRNAMHDLAGVAEVGAGEQLRAVLEVGGAAAAGGGGAAAAAGAAASASGASGGGGGNRRVSSHVLYPLTDEEAEPT